MVIYVDIFVLLDIPVCANGISIGAVISTFLAGLSLFLAL
jgi:hypothetical protein